MIKFTPRFFVLPLVALAVIASLPRPAAHGPIAQNCLAQTPAAGIVRLDIDQAAGCAPVRQQLVMASTQALVR